MKSVSLQFVKYSDIPKRGLLHKCDYAAYPLYIIDKLYNVCIDELLQKPIDLSSLDIPLVSASTALKNFSMYNLYDAVQRIVGNNVSRHVYKPIKSRTNVKEYISSISNKYFSRRITQYDCCIVVDAIEGELCNAYNSIGLQDPFKYVYDMKILDREKSNIILTEAGMLKVLKEEFKGIYDVIRELVYVLQEKMLDVPEVEERDIGLDL